MLIFTDTFPNNFMAYRPPKNQTLSSSATSVTFYYIGVSVAGSGDTQIISSIIVGSTSTDLSYTLSGNLFNNNKDKDIIIRLGQGGVPNTASDVTVRYTISTRGKSYTTNY